MTNWYIVHTSNVSTCDRQDIMCHCAIVEL